MINEISGWFVCLNCGQLFYLEESYSEKRCCPSCHSKEYEVDCESYDYSDYLYIRED